MTQAHEAQPTEILLVEDNPGDVRLTREALREGKIYNNLHCVQDGVEALEFLRQQGKHADAPRPDIILLDLNLPRKDGREVPLISNSTSRPSFLGRVKSRRMVSGPRGSAVFARCPQESRA